MNTAMPSNTRRFEQRPSISNIGSNGVRAVASAAQDRITQTMSATEVKELLGCEEIVSKGWTTFIEVGRALATIRDKRLYRAEYVSFDAYCIKKWQYRKAHAYRLIGAAQVVDYLAPLGDMPKPLNESLVRPLIGLNPEKGILAWKKAREQAGDQRLTAKLVQEAVHQVEPKKESTIKRKNVINREKLAALLKLAEQAEGCIAKGQKNDALDAIRKIKAMVR